MTCPTLRLSYVFVLILASTQLSHAQATTPAETPAASPAASSPLLLKDGTPIRLRTIEKISSHDAKPGDAVKLVADGDVAIGDLVVIQRGAPALGRIAAVQESRRLLRPGELNIALTSVESRSSQPIPLRASEKLQGPQGDLVPLGQHAPTQAATAAATDWPVVLLFKGDNADIPADTIFTVYVDGDVTFEESKLRELPQSWQLKDGTVIRLRTAEKISSKKAKPGSKIDLRVADDVVAGNLIVIRKGSSAEGRVVKAQKNGSLGRGGKLAIELTSVETLAGQVVPLRSSQEVTGKGGGAEIGNAILDLGAKTYGIGFVAAPLFLFFRGDNAEIPADTTLTAYVNGDLTLDPEKLRGLQPPPRSTTGPATVYLFRYEIPRGSTPPVYCGSVLITKLRGKHNVQVRIPPGEYLFQSTDLKHTVKLKADPGQTYYINLTLAMSFRIPMPGQLKLVDPNQGEDALAFRWWIVDPAVDLTSSDPAKLVDTNPPPKQKEEASN